MLHVAPCLAGVVHGPDDASMSSALKGAAPQSIYAPTVILLGLADTQNAAECVSVPQS